MGLGTYRNSDQYNNYTDIISPDLTIELPKNTGINKYTIELIEGKEPPYRSIYALSSVELETLKSYIKTHLKTRFIWPFKSSASTPIFFNKKPNDSLYLCVDDWDLNNLAIKYWYLLPLLGEFLDRFGWAKWFTQLDLTSVYDWMRIQEGDK